jgi:predicted O-methyltransferase YrrM
MKNLPQVSLSFEPLIHMLYGAIPAQLLLTAIERNIFSHLTEPMSAKALAGRLRMPAESTPAFLDALAANDLLCKRDGRYRNTPLADTFLVAGRPTYLGEVFVNLAGYLRPALEALTALAKEGHVASADSSETLTEDRETEIYGNYQRAGRAQQAAAMISQLPEFRGMKKMLDLGAGAGLIGLAIVAAHPTMAGVLFDRPEVVEVARRFTREYELEDRVATVGGDYTTDPIGDGYDLVWTSYTLNFQRGHLEPIMRKIHAALKPGGVHVSLAEGLTHERTKPATLVNSMLAHSLAGRDLVFEEGEVAQAMLLAGFRSVHSRQVEDCCWHGPAILDIARK